jgi:hypothetical protein
MPSPDPAAVAIRGSWWRHVPLGGDPWHRPVAPASNRWQRGEVVAALYLAGSAETAWAEWYRHLAERAIPPMQTLPRDLWRWQVDLEHVADLRAPEALAHGTCRPATEPRWLAAVSARRRGPARGGLASACRPVGGTAERVRAVCVPPRYGTPGGDRAGPAARTG